MLLWLAEHGFFHEWNLIFFRHAEKRILNYDHKTSTTRFSNHFNVLKVFGRASKTIRVPLQTGGKPLQTSRIPFFYQCNNRKTHGGWGKKMVRPSRPISTIDLDKEKKDSLVNDIREYLPPSTRKFHSNRGIPYRRKYLFYGPPGTGKNQSA